MRALKFTLPAPVRPAYVANGGPAIAPLSLLPEDEHTGWIIFGTVKYQGLPQYQVCPENNTAHRRVVRKENILDWVSQKLYEDFEYAEFKRMADVQWKIDQRSELRAQELQLRKADNARKLELKAQEKKMRLFARQRRMASGETSNAETDDMNDTDDNFVARSMASRKRKREAETDERSGSEAKQHILFDSSFGQPSISQPSLSRPVFTPFFRYFTQASDNDVETNEDSLEEDEEEGNGSGHSDGEGKRNRLFYNGREGEDQNNSEMGDRGDHNEALFNTNKSLKRLNSSRCSQPPSKVTRVAHSSFSAPPAVSTSNRKPETPIPAPASIAVGPARKTPPIPRNVMALGTPSDIPTPIPPPKKIFQSKTTSLTLSSLNSMAIPPEDSKFRVSTAGSIRGTCQAPAGSSSPKTKDNTIIVNAKLKTSSNDGSGLPIFTSPSEGSVSRRNGSSSCKRTTIPGNVVKDLDYDLVKPSRRRSQSSGLDDQVEHKSRGTNCHNPNTILDETLQDLSPVAKLPSQRRSNSRDWELEDNMFSSTPSMLNPCSNTLRSEMANDHERHAHDRNGGLKSHKKKARKGRASSIPMEDDVEDEKLEIAETEWEIKSLLNDEMRRDSKGARIRHYLVDWEGNWNPTWEPEYCISEIALSVYKRRLEGLNLDGTHDDNSHGGENMTSDLKQHLEKEDGFKVSTQRHLITGLKTILVKNEPPPERFEPGESYSRYFVQSHSYCASLDEVDLIRPAVDNPRGPKTLNKGQAEYFDVLSGSGAVKPQSSSGIFSRHASFLQSRRVD